jgi:hypothetical protein
MAGDYINFLFIYFVLVVMFSIIGNLNFVNASSFGTLFDSTMTMMDASMGNFDFSIWEEIEDPLQQNLGKVFLTLAVVLFAILILNLIIAILSNTYNIFDPKSNGLFLSKILQTRDEMQYDPKYGAFMSQLTPLNIVFFPFLPLAIIDKFYTELVNKIALNIQYILLMMVVFTQFIIVSALLSPFAFLKSLTFKIQDVFRASNTSQLIHKALYVAEFFFLGIFSMIMTFLVDCIYFWINNFRVKLKKIIIDREPSTITMSWVKKLNLLAKKYAHHKIKSVNTVHFVSKFREDIDINA